MEHINDFTIGRFRGLRDLKIENLGQVNLFVGNNNSGKTSVLEAAYLFCDPVNGRRWYDIASQREASGTPRAPLTDQLMWLFLQEGHDRQTASPESVGILLSASGNLPTTRVSASYEFFTEIVTRSGSVVSKVEEMTEEREIEDREVEGIKIHISIATTSTTQLTLFGGDTAPLLKETLTFSDNRPFPIRRQERTALPSQIVNPFSHRTSGLTTQLWSQVVEANLKEETIQLLHFFDLGIQDVDFISLKEGRQFISIKHEKSGRVPLYAFGDGLRRVFTLAVTIPRARNGLLLIDELETSIHTKALEKTFDWLVKACIRNNIQLLATTHSLEALDALLEVSREQADLVVYRLQQDKQQTTTTRLNKEITLRLREELGMELRY